MLLQLKETVCFQDKRPARVQWENADMACSRPWVQSQKPTRNKKKHDKLRGS